MFSSLLDYYTGSVCLEFISLGSHVTWHTPQGPKCKPQHAILFWWEHCQGPLMGTCCWEHPFLGKHKVCLPSSVWLTCSCLMMIPPFLPTGTLPSSAKSVNFLENKAQVLLPRMSPELLPLMISVLMSPPLARGTVRTLMVLQPFHACLSC